VTTPRKDPRSRATPLTGVRVVEFRTHAAGAFAALTLADLGADVVKVEDMGREKLPVNPDIDGQDCDRLAYDRNKRSLLLNLGFDEAKVLLRDLVQGADILVTECDPAMLAPFGFAQYPRLVHCALGAVRADGTGDTSGEDLLTQALSGCMDLTGAPGDPPTRTGVPLGAITAGLYGVIAALAGLRLRARQGTGVTVGVNAYDSLLACMNYVLTVYANTGRTSTKVGAGHPTIYPYNAFRTLDSHIVVACFTQDFWRKYCKAIGRLEIAEDPRFKSFASRLSNKSALSEILNSVMRTRTTAEWERVLTEGDVPVGPILSVRQALEHAQSRERGMLVGADGADVVDLRHIRSPFRFNGAGIASVRAAPGPGQDSIEVVESWLTQGAQRGVALAVQGAIVQRCASKGILP